MGGSDTTRRTSASGARRTTTIASCDHSSSALSKENRNGALCVFASTVLTCNLSGSISHASQCFEALLAILAHVFVDRHSHLAVSPVLGFYRPLRSRSMRPVFNKQVSIVEMERSIDVGVSLVDSRRDAFNRTGGFHNGRNRAPRLCWGKPRWLLLGLAAHGSGGRCG